MRNPDTATGRLDPAARSGTATPWAWRERYETIAAIAGMVGVVVSGATAVTLLGLISVVLLGEHWWTHWRTALLAVSCAGLGVIPILQLEAVARALRRSGNAVGLLVGSAAAWCGLAIMPVVVFTAWYPVLLGPPLSVLAASVALLVCDRAASRMK